MTNKKEDDPAVVIPGSHGSLATTKYDVIFHGKSSHAGGSPEVGRNVMLAVGTAILNLYAIPRHSGGVSRVNVGTVVAGSGRNVIADEAKMEIEVRGETTCLLYTSRHPDVPGSSCSMAVMQSMFLLTGMH